MARRSVLACVALTLSLFGCSRSGGTDQQTREPQDETTSAAAEGGSQPTGENEEKSGAGAKLLETGFGQDGEYARTGPQRALASEDTDRSSASVASRLNEYRNYSRRKIGPSARGLTTAFTALSIAVHGRSRGPAARGSMSGQTSSP